MFVEDLNLNLDFKKRKTRIKIMNGCAKASKSGCNEDDMENVFVHDKNRKILTPLAFQ